MGYPLRSSDPARLHFITVRTEGQTFFLRPSKDVNKTIGGIIARYQEILQVEIFAYTIMSNHMHLVVRAPLGNLDEFMENVDREIARRINHKHRRKGRFWSRRYRPLAIVTDKDLEGAFLYTVTNAVHHGGARHPSEWPGLCSYQQNISEKPLTFAFYHYSEPDENKRTTHHQLTISPLPQFKDLSHRERSKRISKLIDDRTGELIEKRESEGKGFLTKEQVRAIDPFETSKVRKRSSAGGCYSKDAAIIREFKRIEAQKRVSYSLSSLRFRLGELLTTFPEFTFKPPLHRKPRVKAFTPLPDDYFLAQAA